MSYFWYWYHCWRANICLAKMVRCETIAKYASHYRQGAYLGMAFWWSRRKDYHIMRFEEAKHQLEDKLFPKE